MRTSFIILLLKVRALSNPIKSLVQYIVLGQSARLNKAPYADSYWFLYSAKLTYYTSRYLPAKRQ